MSTWAIAMAVAVVVTTTAFGEEVLGPRVRSSDGRLQALIADASLRSPTFVALIRAIDATNAVVYLEMGRCPHGVQGCLMSVEGTREHRFLRIRINANRGQEALMATIAHELRHALEILDDPTITSTRGMVHFYLRNGSRRPGGSNETEAAMETGRAVSAELAQNRKVAAREAGR